MQGRNRSGLTLIEVVVTVVMLLVIMALMIPAIRSSRTTQVRTVCLNNERNLVLGILYYVIANKHQLPAQAYFPATFEDDDNRVKVFAGRSWTVEVLPYLDQQGTFDRWTFEEPWHSRKRDNFTGVSNSELADFNFYAFTCSEDQTAHGQPGGISYVVNCGIGDSQWKTTTGIRDADRIESGHHPLAEPFDWNGNGVAADTEDVSVTRDLMLFWPSFETFEDGESNRPAMERHAIGRIYDGTSNTIMLGENVNAGANPGGKRSSWADPKLSSTGFLLPVKPHTIVPSSHSVDGSLATFVVNKPFDPAINAARSAGEGLAPFPNSNHPGLSVFTFCDGSCRTISEDIDLQVYARLLTPCGTRLRQIPDFVPEEPLASEEF